MRKRRTWKPLRLLASHVWVLVAVLMLAAFLGSCESGAPYKPPEQRLAEAYGEAQAACYAAELAAESSSELDAKCVQAAYDLCRELWRQQRLVWYSPGVIGPRNRDGSPRWTLEQRHEMAHNHCEPKF